MTPSLPPLVLSSSFTAFALLARMVGGEPPVAVSVPLSVPHACSSSGDGRGNCGVGGFLRVAEPLEEEDDETFVFLLPVVNKCLARRREAKVDAETETFTNGRAVDGPGDKHSKRPVFSSPASDDLLLRGDHRSDDVGESGVDAEA